ncbi:MAG: hypothetical protein JOZ62_14920, partial [Acidobacteriaceae bacterium]|nr:hypothetical protein [Acidobacteriaceae bacterium]
AIAQGLARVTELTADGSVPELRFENDSDQPVLLLDGEELIGAKQNRILNVTVLAPAKQAIVIPVSCVESGRWNMATPEFKTADHGLFLLARAKRTAHVTASMRASGTRQSDQSAIWNDIAQKSARMKTSSPTGAMSAVYEKHAASVDQYVNAFNCDPLQAGVIFVIPGSCTGVDLFDNPASLHRLFPKLVRSYALDALEAHTPASQAGDPSEVATKIFEEIIAAPSFTQRAVGMGEEIRMDDSSLSGAALWALDRYVHVCAFVPDRTHGSNESRTRIDQPSRRYSQRTRVH